MDSQKLQAALAHVEEHRQEYLEKLFDLLRQPSVSSERRGVEECARTLTALLESFGLKSSLHETGGYPIVYAEAPGESPYTVLFYGHYDVQPADEPEWLSDPFAPVVRDGRIYARGVGDNKGQLLAHVLAVRSWLQTAGSLPVSVKFVFEGEEESGSPHIAGFVERNRDLLAADVVYTADGPMHDSGRPVVCFGVRGILYVELEARGPRTEVHSGNRGNVAPNPAWTLIDLLRTMRDENGRVLIEGFYDRVRRPTPFERALAAGIPFDPQVHAQALGLAGTPIRDAADYADRLMFQPTFNIAGFTSGYGGPGMKTIIPSRALLKMDMRLVADQDPDEIYEQFAEHVRRHAPDVTVRKLGTMRPSRTSPELPVSRRVIDAVKRARGQEPVVMPAVGGSLPDYVWTHLLGAPSIMVPYGDPDQNNHGPNEHMAVDTFFAGIRTSLYVLDALGDLAATGHVPGAAP